MNVVLNASSEKRNNTHVLPTPESPISSSLNNKSYVFLAMVELMPSGAKFHFPKAEVCLTFSAPQNVMNKSETFINVCT